MDASSYFRGKKITLMGLGLLGRGVGDAKYLASCGADLIVTDLKTREQLEPSLLELASFPNITYSLGEHKLEDFKDRDLIIKAAGVPLDSPFVAEAEKNGIPVRMSADLFAELAQIPVIGVTGTRGKSTVTYMITAILKEAGKKVLLGGNVRGVSNLQLLQEATPEHVAVLELDSWQLQGFGAARKSPNISVFTTFYPDHLNYYGSTLLTTGKNDLDAYLADKANIFRYQTQDDTIILGSQVADLIKTKYGPSIVSHLLVADTKDLPKGWVLKIPGEHNRYNAALALTAARAAGIDDVVSRKAVESFGGVPGRLELVREVKGIKIYNDTTATTPEAALAALEALDKNIILIAGGADKGLDMNKLLLEIPKHTKRVILLAGTGTGRVLEFLPGASVFDDLESAVKEAFIAAEPGDFILLSPAFASFGMFKNEYDRGDQFNAIVKSL